MKALLVLEDGAIFEGKSFGAEGEKYGEVVFNTSMSGYQEILTDPSYKGQIVMMTYPLIGNYGSNISDFESTKPFAEGFIVKECSRISSNFRSETDFSELLKKNNIVAIEGIDTRSLTRRIRLSGAMKAVISTIDADHASLLEKVKKSQGLVGVDLVKEVTCKKEYKWDKKGFFSVPCTPRSVQSFKVVVLDCGVKYNILNELAARNCEVNVVPANTSANEILKINPDGILLSNGPGDPSAVPYVINTVSELIQRTTNDERRIVIFGICLGHQMLGLALGGKTYKLKFGHHGGNHPVKDIKTGKIAITAQNHGFCVDMETIKDQVEITHINLYDKTCEGMKHKKLPIFSVQYHPEASPGPHDSEYLFDEFIAMMDKTLTSQQGNK